MSQLESGAIPQGGLPTDGWPQRSLPGTPASTDTDGSSTTPNGGTTGTGVASESQAVEVATMTPKKTVTRLRRFLRDPDGHIWSDADLIRYWNDAIYEFSLKAVGLLKRVDVYRYPPAWTWVYMWDWEWQYTDGDRRRCLEEWQEGGMVVCYPWEPGGHRYDNSSTPDTSGGYRYTMPFEAYAGGGKPADPIPVPLHHRFDRAEIVAYDEEVIAPATLRGVGLEDSWYKTRTGEPSVYYRHDQSANELYLWPAPPIAWDEWDVAETFDDDGGLITDTEGYIDYADEGMVTDKIDPDGAILMVYDSIPTIMPTNDEGQWDDPISDWPEWAVHYLEAGTLERCFGADTDGFIPSLRDYWRNRKQIGIEVIKQWRGSSKVDRDYRLGGYSSRQGRTVRGPRLPSEYPRSM